MTKTFYLRSSRNDREKELIERRVLIEKGSVDSFSFLLPWDGKHCVARRNAKQTIGKQCFATLEEQRPETI